MRRLVEEDWGIGTWTLFKLDCAIRAIKLDGRHGCKWLGKGYNLQLVAGVLDAMSAVAMIVTSSIRSSIYRNGYPRSEVLTIATVLVVEVRAHFTLRKVAQHIHAYKRKYRPLITVKATAHCIETNRTKTNHQIYPTVLFVELFRCGRPCSDRRSILTTDYLRRFQCLERNFRPEDRYLDV
jgi:hypothetical protein